MGDKLTWLLTAIYLLAADAYGSDANWPKCASATTLTIGAALMR
jgi:hypothetical protein